MCDRCGDNKAISNSIQTHIVNVHRKTFLNYFWYALCASKLNETRDQTKSTDFWIKKISIYLFWRSFVFCSSLSLSLRSEFYLLVNFIGKSNGAYLIPIPLKLFDFFTQFEIRQANTIFNHIYKFVMVHKLNWLMATVYHKTFFLFCCWRKKSIYFWWIQDIGYWGDDAEIFCYC